MLRAGSLNRSVNIERATVLVNEYGEEELTFVVIKTTRASINPITGNEGFSVGIKNEISHKIAMRFDPSLDLKNSDVIVYEGRRFDIQNILNWNERKSHLTLLVLEKLYEQS